MRLTEIVIKDGEIEERIDKISDREVKPFKRKRRNEDLEERREEARRLIIDRIARRDYNGVLELASLYDITIHRSHSEKIALFYSRTDSLTMIELAREAYAKMGNQEAATLAGCRISEIESGRNNRSGYFFNRH